MTKPLLAGMIVAVLVFSRTAAAQAGALNLTFAYRSATNPDTTPVANGGTINFPSVSLNQTSIVTFVVTNTGGVTYQITGAATTTPFKVIDQTPISVPAGQSVPLTLSFTPTSSKVADVPLNVQFQGSSLPQPANLLFFLHGTGLAPQFVFSYVLNPTGNQLLIDDGGVIQFPATTVQTSNTATFTIANTGNGQGIIRAISIGGEGFSLTGLPLLGPTGRQIDPQGQISFNIVFAPATSGNFQGSLTVQSDTATKTIGLAGQGLQAQLSYLFGTQMQQVNAGGTFNLPDTNVGTSNQIAVQVHNTGNTGVQIHSVAALPAVGTGGFFQISGLLPLPVTIEAGGTMQFTLTFSPTDPGIQTGTLLVQRGTATVTTDVINLTGKAVGSRFSFSVQIGSTTNPLANNGTILFPNTSVGTASLATVLVENTGNVSGTINNINLTGPGYSPSGAPALPLTLSAGSSASFGVSFQPLFVGAATGTLNVDALHFVLQGTATAPQALPGVVFTNVPATVAPQEQPSVGLSLSAPYALDLTGTLNLTFASDSFVDDPAIQFSTSGRSVTFRIPANTTDAIFGQNQKSVQFQAGSVAGVVSFQAKLGTAGVDLTPTPAPSASVVIPGTVPQIQSLVIGSRTQNSVTLVMTGYSTPRTMGQLSFHFTAAPGYSLQTPDLSNDVSTVFGTWYQSGASQPFGSQFSVSFQIAAFSGDFNGVQSVSVTASNAKGVSSPASVALR